MLDDAISQLRKANPTIMRSHCTCNGMVVASKLKITNVGEDLEKHEPLYSAGGDLQGFSCCGRV